LEALHGHSVRQPGYPSKCGAGGLALRYDYRFALNERLFEY